MSLRVTSLIVLSVLSGCAKSQEDPVQYRAILMDKMLDPSSAQFRNERVRTLWTKTGSRLKLYCAEINGKNAFGGYAGFKRSYAVIDAKLVNQPTWTILKKGAGWIGVGPSSYYLNCLRADRERKDEWLGAIFGFDGDELTDQKRATIDRSFPVLSDDDAPK